MTFPQNVLLAVLVLGTLVALCVAGAILNGQVVSAYELPLQHVSIEQVDTISVNVAIASSVQSDTGVDNSKEELNDFAFSLGLEVGRYYSLLLVFRTTQGTPARKAEAAHMLQECGGQGRMFNTTIRVSAFPLPFSLTPTGFEPSPALFDASIWECAEVSFAGPSGVPQGGPFGPCTPELVPPHLDLSDLRPSSLNWTTSDMHEPMRWESWPSAFELVPFFAEEDFDAIAHAYLSPQPPERACGNFWPIKRQQLIQLGGTAIQAKCGPFASQLVSITTSERVDIEGKSTLQAVAAASFSGFSTSEECDLFFYGIFAREVVVDTIVITYLNAAAQLTSYVLTASSVLVFLFPTTARVHRFFAFGKYPLGCLGDRKGNAADLLLSSNKPSQTFAM